MKLSLKQTFTISTVALMVAGLTACDGNTSKTEPELFSHKDAGSSAASEVSLYGGIAPSSLDADAEIVSNFAFDEGEEFLTPGFVSSHALEVKCGDDNTVISSERGKVNQNFKLEQGVGFRRWDTSDDTLANNYWAQPSVVFGGGSYLGIKEENIPKYKEAMDFAINYYYQITTSYQSQAIGDVIDSLDGKESQVTDNPGYISQADVDYYVKIALKTVSKPAGLKNARHISVGSKVGVFELRGFYGECEFSVGTVNGTVLDPMPDHDM
ncbi:hypothetical protein QTO01_16500 [Vibrio mytili]|uniref:hypothetical protein n=1 Tax=Vibrio mytili TaxID=50718 RepID=UPI002F40CA1A